MERKYKVITLCGSIKFKDEFLKVQQQLTLQGNIVINVDFLDNSPNPIVITPKIKAMLDGMHKQRIDMADEIFVINKGGYIGSSTKKWNRICNKNK